jgi:hypothetical protein
MNKPAADLPPFFLLLQQGAIVGYSAAIGTRLEITVEEVLHRDGEDSFEPKWAIAVADDGTSYLLYGVRHEVAAHVGMRAVMEYRANDRWVLIEEIKSRPS